MLTYLKGLDGEASPARTARIGQEDGRPVGPCRVRRVALPGQVTKAGDTRDQSSRQEPVGHED